MVRMRAFLAAGTTSGLGNIDVHGLGPLLNGLGALGSSGFGSATSGLEGLSAFDTATFGALADGSRTRFPAGDRRSLKALRVASRR